ncbi:MAG TPA: type VI secretion system tip protein VgrG [Rhizobacter sp.]|nr:type VI secretion system tip protein VgrG [Rhizobacter sp.]
MADSPLLDAEGVVRVSISSNGNALPETASLVSLSVQRAINMVPTARLVFNDGDMPEQSFPLSDTDELKPGAAIKVSAGYGNDETTIFEGVVIKHSLRVAGNNDARLVVECRDKAVAMTIGRCNANFVDQTDSDIIGKLISAHGLTADVESTSVQFGELVQYYCSDWDYLLSRADANGLLVAVTDGTVAVKSPDASAEPVLTVSYGLDLIEFQAEMDARTQFASAQATSWDMKTQAVVQGTAASPETLNAQGNLDSATLAKVIALDSYRLQTAAPVLKESLTGWAKAQQRKAALARLRGRIRFQGSAKTKLGSLIELVGVGQRFSGKVFVGAFTHEIADGNWITEVEFGLSPAWFTERPDVMSRPAAGLVPGVEGLQIGVVKKLDADPDGEQRIQVSVPVMQAATDGVWARLASLHGSKGFGTFFIPEVGDEVILGYFNNDPSYPVILGSLYSSQRAPAYALAAENDTKAIVTRSKLKLEFDEKDKVITITTPGNNKIVLSDKDKSILLQDQNSNKVELAPGGITLDSPKDIKLTAKGTITVDAVGAITISSKADVKSSGLNVNCEAQVGFVGKGSATAELSASGQTTVKGAMVMIN